MENFPTWLPVVAAAIYDRAGRILLQQRPAGKHHGGLWEFPGGKVETGETPREALVREVNEELGIWLEPAQLCPAGLADDEGAQSIVLLLYTTDAEIGRVVPHDGQLWGWFTCEEAAALQLAPMDRHLLRQLPG